MKSFSSIRYIKAYIKASMLVNVVQHCFVAVDLQEILKLSAQDDGDAHLRFGSKIKNQMKTLCSVWGLGIHPLAALSSANRVKLFP